ncbi:UPF0236 family protein [Deltaproteobacteria bacterium TL4]
MEWLNVGIEMGFGEDTKVHGIGDGAPWIANQLKLQFGENSRYLIDFYHLCEYLDAAAKVCANDEKDSWVENQKKLLKSNGSAVVLDNLLPYLEPLTISDEKTPVRACYRYIFNRPEQFHYQEALEENLPIGSGEIESSHRYIIQDRMKLPGAWWEVNNAKKNVGLETFTGKRKMGKLLGK